MATVSGADECNEEDTFGNRGTTTQDNKGTKHSSSEHCDCQCQGCCAVTRHGPYTEEVLARMARSMKLRSLGRYCFVVSTFIHV